MYYYMGRYHLINCHNSLWLCKIVYKPFLRKEKRRMICTHSPFIFILKVYFILLIEVFQSRFRRSQPHHLRPHQLVWKANCGGLKGFLLRRIIC